ncbi:MAG: hypothetical protein EHM21_04440, partial [Chloroflexi bacterium]
TDKGVPAALVMATTRSILRTAAERLVSPGAVLEQANNNLCPDIPPNMFVTCLYALLEPSTGKVIFANAGHNLPYQRTRAGVVELRARGMPLGLMPEMPYEEKEAYLSPGDQIILYSDGLIEAHNPSGEMFSFPRLRDILGRPACANEMIPCMLSELADFTGSDWEQEDDVTFVSLARDPEPTPDIPGPGQTPEPAEPSAWVSLGERQLGSFSIASQPGNERQAMDQVSEAVAQLNLPAPLLERLKTAVAEATMNAMEHGNHYQSDLPVEIEVILTENAPGKTAPDESRAGPSRQLVVRIRDYGGSQIIPQSEAPDLDAKLAGLQSPRGWGLFLIKNMVDELQVTSDETHHTVELILHLEREA